MAVGRAGALRGARREARTVRTERRPRQRSMCPASHAQQRASEIRATGRVSARSERTWEKRRKKSLKGLTERHSGEARDRLWRSGRERVLSKWVGSPDFPNLCRTFFLQKHKDPTHEEIELENLKKKT